jgi:glycosyltransferase involved in cell wall biosynthesis
MKIGLATAPDVSWKVIRERWITLFDDAGVDYVRHDLEDQVLPGPRIPHAYLRALLGTRQAVLRALDDGADRVLLTTTNHCALLPRSVASRVYVYGDCTPSQFRELGYLPPRRGLRNREGFAAWRIGRFMHHGATALCLTEQFRQRAIWEWGLPPERAHLLPPPLDTTLYAPAADRPSRTGPGAPLRALFVGSEFHRKGGDVVEALIDDPRTSAWHWDMVTPHEPSPRPTLTWHRWAALDALVELYQSADLYVLPTRADTTPQTCGEASACGTPVLTTDVGAMRELVIDGVTGTLVPPGEYEPLVQAMLAYERAPDLRERHGAAGRAHVEPRLNADAHLRRLLDILGG